MAIKLHRCQMTFAKAKGHPCWKVQSALDEAGIDYEVVKEPIFRWNRKAYKKATGVSVLPALEFEDGTFLREESDDLAARIREGRLPTGSG
jgi:glutathione S-transferase